MHIKHFLMCSVAATVLLNGMNVHALQTDSTDAETELEEIIVTTTRRETRLLDTPISVTAVSDEALTRLNITNVKNLAQLVPGLQLRDNGVDGQGSVDINLRGVGNSNFIETAESNVAFNIDGVYTARPQAALQLFNDVQRVEVARGPQGTLQGRNATIGSINVITRRPDLEDFSVQAQVEYGSFDAVGYKATVNVPVTDTFAIRANYANYERESHSDLVEDRSVNNNITQLCGGCLGSDPFRNNDSLPIFSTGGQGTDGFFLPFFETNFGNGGDEGVGSFGSEDTEAYRISALFKPSDNFSAYLTYEKFKNNALGNPASIDCDRADCEQFFTPDQIRQSGPGVSFLSLRGLVDQDIDNYRGVIEYTFDDLFTVKYTGGHSDFTNVSVQDLDFGVGIELVNIDGGAITNPVEGPLTDPFVNESTVHDIQFTSAHGGRLNWTGGFFDYSERTSRQLFVSFFHFGQVAFPNPDYRVDTKAAYFDATYELNETTEVFGGIRYTDDKKSNEGAAEFRLQSAACAAEIQNNPNNLTPGANFADAGAQALVESPACRVGSTEAPQSNDDFFDFRIGINHNISDDVLVYASISSGHKAALQDQVFNLTRFSPQQVTIPVATEKLLSYEVGAKGKWRGITFSTAAFYLDYEDKQEAQFFNFGDNACDLDGNGLNGGEISGDGSNPAEELPGCGIGFDPTTNPLATPDLNDNEFADNIQFAVVPAASVEIYGLELEASTPVGANGFLSGFLTWTHARYREFNYSHVLGCPNPALQDRCDVHDVAGNVPRSTPTWTANVTYTHYIDVGQFGKIIPTVNAYYRSKYFLTPENIDEGEISAADIGFAGTTFLDGSPGINDNETSLFADNQDASIKVNFNVTWEFSENLALDVFGTNIFDANVRSHIRIDTANTPLFVFEDPAEFGVRLRASF